MADPSLIVVKPLLEALAQKTQDSIVNRIVMIESIKEHVKKLKSNFSAILSVLTDAEEKQFRDRAIKDWLRKLQDAAFDAQDILETYQTQLVLAEQEKKLDQDSFKEEIVDNIKAISERFDEIMLEKQRFHLEVKPSGISLEDNYPRTGFLVDETTVVGRDADKEEIIRLLLSDESDREGEVSILPITGMAGLGKTTLAQLVYNDKSISEHYSLKMWVCVTANFNLSRVLRGMIESYSDNEVSTNLTLVQLQNRLIKYLPGKRFLLILDDVWTKNANDWETLLDPLKKGERGSRVLITSRIENVPDTNGTLSPYNLKFLPQEECWRLFEKNAFSRSMPELVREDLENIGHKIVAKCKGLPLAVKAMAGILKGKVNRGTWLKILHSEIWELEDDEAGMVSDKPKILPALKLSYDYLPSNLKLCLAYCSIFPKAYKFDKDQLVQLWMAENLIKARGLKGMTMLEEMSVEYIDELKANGVEYFNELLIRSFFQRTQSKFWEETFVMHDLIHDLLQTISSHFTCQVKGSGFYNFCNEESRYISILCNDVEQATLEIVEHSKKVRTILLPSYSWKIVGKGLEKLHKLKFLRVLDLSFSDLLELPRSIENLILLRYLDLSRTRLQKIPEEVCKLHHLQTLKLLSCNWLQELPKDLRRLVNLRHLLLDNHFWLTISSLPPKIGTLNFLHNLHAFPIGCEDGHGIGELKNLKFLTGSLSISKLENATTTAEAKLKEKGSIQRLRLEWSDSFMLGNNEDQLEMEERKLQELQPHSNLEELEIYYFPGKKLPSWLNNDLRKLKTLLLKGSKHCKTLSFILPHLCRLELDGLTELEDCSKIECPKLEELSISDCPKVKRFPGVLVSLRELYVRCCYSLEALPMAPNLESLRLLQNPVLENWNEELVHFTCEDEDEDDYPLSTD